MRPFFSFYGGKWRDSLNHYPPPEHHLIVEPFAGSAGYAMRYPNHEVVLCDIDPYIAGVWEYLIATSPAEIRAIPDIPEGGTIDDLDVCPEARMLVGFWLNRGGEMPRRTPSQWMRSGIRPGSFWGARVRETIASQVDSIRHWKIYNVDYRECPVTGPATWFIDPPYQQSGSRYRFGSELLNYHELARWCQEREGQVIVCEQEGASWLPFLRLRDVKTTRAGRRSTEVAWMRDAHGQQTLFSVGARAR